jgi:hypothetical protein
MNSNEDPTLYYLQIPPVSGLAALTDHLTNPELLRATALLIDVTNAFLDLDESWLRDFSRRTRLPRVLNSKRTAVLAHRGRQQGLVAYYLRRAGVRNTAIFDDCDAAVRWLRQA